MPKYKIVEEDHDYNGKTMRDLVCYFGETRFVLVPLSRSKRSRAYFYSLLKQEA